MRADDSTSMKFDDGGERVKTLQQVLHVITHFYALSQPDGKIKAVRFMNRRPGLDNATPEEIMEHISKHRYEGMTRIGKELEKKILRPFVSKQMTRPLLVMIITDGDVSTPDEAEAVWADLSSYVCLDRRRAGGLSAGGHQDRGGAALAESR